MRDATYGIINTVRQQRITMYKSHMTEYHIWLNMKRRCNNPASNVYDIYGGRGIKVCQEWEEDFWQFYNDVGPRPSKDYSLDRIDGNGDYEPNNVKWATWQEQNRNKPLQHNNTSGVKGVSYRKKYGTWAAYIHLDKKKRHLGTFKTFDEAVAARKAAEAEFHT